MQNSPLLVFLLITSSCTPSAEENVKVKTVIYQADTQITQTDTPYHIESGSSFGSLDTGLVVEHTEATNNAAIIKTGPTTPKQLVSFAKTLTNIPYKYGSVNPDQGFDCSGFVTYVFNHFGIGVPRSSVGFDAPSARTVSLANAKAGDLILFTGTDSTKKVVGHMGIIISGQNEQLAFIHSTSGKAFGVTETALNSYYQGRFMRAIRVFSQNDR